MKTSISEAKTIKIGMVYFDIPLLSLKEILKREYSALKKRSKNSLKTTLELTLDGNKLSFAIPGAYFFIEGDGSGICKATMNFAHFHEIVSDCKSGDIRINFLEKSIQIGDVSLYAQSVFFNDTNRYRTIELPANYTELDLVRLKKMKYTVEELIFNNLYDRVEKANQDYNLKLDKAVKLFENYNISRSDLVKFLNRKMGLD
jgi:hypothetical protein